MKADRPHQLLDRRREFFAFVAVLFSLLALAPALSGPFFSDDYLYVVDNEALRRIPLAEGWRIFAGGTNPWEYLPLRDLSYRLDMSLFGDRPLGYHVHNLVLYALCCSAAYAAALAVVRLLGGLPVATSGVDPSRSLAAAAAAIFAAHPAHVESVAWISGRKDLLSGLFALLSLSQFAAGLAEKRIRRRRLLAANALFLAALLAKTTVAPLCLVAGLLAAAHFHGSERPRAALGRAALLSAPLVALAAAATLLASLVGTGTGIRAQGLAALLARDFGGPHGALRILGVLARIAVLPLGLRLTYDVFDPGPAGILAEATGAIVIPLAVIGAGMAWRRRSVVGFGLAAFVFFCLPFLQLMPFLTWSAASERFLFLPIFGLALSASVALGGLRPRPRAVLATPLLVAALGVTASRSAEWQSPAVLVTRNAHSSPGDIKAATIAIDDVLLPKRRYGEALATASRVRSGRQLLVLCVQARQAYDEGRASDALRLLPALEGLVGRDSSAGALFLVGQLDESQGRDFDAARNYLFGAQKPGAAPTYGRQCAEALRRIQYRYGARLAELRESVRQRPGDVSLRAELADLAMEVGLVDEASVLYRAIVGEYPTLAAAHYNLAMVLNRQQRFAEAVREYEAVLAGDATAAIVWNDLGVTYQEMGDVERAERAFRRALDVDPRHYYAAFNLGNLHRLAGQLARAREELQLARERALAAGDSTAAIDAVLAEMAASPVLNPPR